ncbi:MAG: 30S ribosomal protein S8 [bacterium]
MHTDPISDMLTRIRNAQAIGKTDVVVPMSKIKLALAKILKDNRFIASYEASSVNEKPCIFIELSYSEDRPRIHEISRISKPGCRSYIKSKNLHRFLHGHGIYIVSTSKGLMTGREANKENLGGELICSVW